MVKCAKCKKEVSDIRPQKEGVGVCWDCGSKDFRKYARHKK